MKVGDEVRFLDPRTKTWHEGTLVALDEPAGTARVDTDDCGGVVDVALETSPLFVTHEARASNTKLLPRWQPKEPAEKSAEKPEKESKGKSMESTEMKMKGRHRSPERMAELRRQVMETPIPCSDCKADFTRESPNQKRCPTCQAKHTQNYHHQWHLRKKARLAAAGSDGSNGKPAAAAVIPAPVAPAKPAAKHTPPAALPAPAPVPAPAPAPLPVGGTGWLAFAARHRQIAALAEQIASLMADGGAA